MISETQWIRMIKEELEYYMKVRGISQQELADKARLDKSSISRYLNGERLMSLKAAVNISQALGIEVSDLVDFDRMIE